MGEGLAEGQGLPRGAEFLEQGGRAGGVARGGLAGGGAE